MTSSFRGHTRPLWYIPRRGMAGLVVNVHLISEYTATRFCKVVLPFTPYPPQGMRAPVLPHHACMSQWTFPLLTLLVSVRWCLVVLMFTSLTITLSALSYAWLFVCLPSLSVSSKKNKKQNQKKCQLTSFPSLFVLF